MKALDLAEQKIIGREGFGSKVYLDTLNMPTGGYGHKILPEDNMSVGDEVSRDQAEIWLQKDLAWAYKLGIQQAGELGKLSAEFIAALTCANFQLGNFEHKFPITFDLLKAKSWSTAILDLRKSLWMKETPERVNDLISSIEKAYSPSLMGKIFNLFGA